MAGALSSGDWLTHQRVRRIAVVCLLLWVGSLLLLFATAHGTLD